MVSTHGAFILRAVSLFAVCEVICAVHAILPTSDVRRILAVLPRRLCRRDVILSQAVRICPAQPVLRNRILVSVCSLFNCIINENVCVSVFKTRIDVVLKASITVFKHLFCVTSSFPPGPPFSLLVGLCQIVDAYVIAGLTTAEYTCLAFEKDAPHVDAAILDSAMYCVAIFAFTVLMCGPQFSFQILNNIKY